MLKFAIKSNSDLFGPQQHVDINRENRLGK